MDPGTLKAFAEKYCYQYVCQGEPSWPKIVLTAGVTEEMLINRIEQECEPIRALINQRVTLATLSSSPEKAYKCLEYILNQYENEHSHFQPFHVRRLPLPRLFTILPTPSLHWRYITISANALSAFTKNRLPSGYFNQLTLFQEVFDFNALKTARRR